MNNSKLAIDSVSLSLEEKVDYRPKLQEEEAELIKIISAIQRVAESEDWSSLKTKLFDGLTESLTKELFSEARKDNPDTLRLARLAGQLKWAERFSDLSMLEQEFRGKLTNVRMKLHGTT